MFESSFECMDMCRERRMDLIRRASNEERCGRVKPVGNRKAGRERLLAAALIVRSLLL